MQTNSITKPAAVRIADALGRSKIAKRKGVTPAAISAALKEVDSSGAPRQPKFPAAYYRVVRDMCLEAEIECPDEAFNFDGGE
tara:strand:+ start:854 stop:1102 length:249 start_codon:yes stop_codon:yes gene_type:complete